MVFHTGVQGKADDKASLTDAPERTNNRPAKSCGSRNCHLISSIMLNVIMLTMLIAAAGYLTRYRRLVCDMQVKYDSERFDSLGVPYKDMGCHIEPLYEDFAEIASNQRGDMHRSEGELVLDDLNDRVESMLPKETKRTRVPMDASKKTKHTLPIPNESRRHHRHHHTHHGDGPTSPKAQEGMKNRDIKQRPFQHPKRHDEKTGRHHHNHSHRATPKPMVTP